jgi:hypothetical protein
MSPYRSGPAPYLSSPRDRALWAVAHGRTRELDLSGLTLRDLADMRTVLVADRRRARRQHLFDHMVGAAITVAFLAVGFAMMIPGPWLAGSLQGAVFPQLIFDGHAVLWVLLVALLILGATAADYLLRRRIRLLRGHGEFAARLTDDLRWLDAAIAQREAEPARVPASPPRDATPPD